MGPEEIAALLQSIYEVAAETAVTRAAASEGEAAQTNEVASPSAAAGHALPAVSQEAGQQPATEQPPGETAAGTEEASQHPVTEQPSLQTSAAHEEASPHPVTEQPSLQTSISHEEASQHPVTEQPSLWTSASHEEASQHPVTEQPSVQTAASPEEASQHPVTEQPSLRTSASHEEASPHPVTEQPSFQTTGSHEEVSQHPVTEQPSLQTSAGYEERTPAPVTTEPSFAASASIVEESPASPMSYEADWPMAEMSRETRGTEPSTEESEMERTFYRTPEEPVEEKKPKEITWTSLSVATEDVLDSLETAVQYTSMARTLREKGLLSRGIRMMERALAIVERRELAHPALCLEAAKVRLNYAAYLSEGYRHRPALQIIKDAQESLTRLLQWAVQCPPEDLAVQALGREARALHTAAIVAEAMAVEYCDEDDFDAPDGPDDAAKETARVAAAGLAPEHPLAMLVRQNLGAAPRMAGGRKQSTLGMVVRKRVSNIPLQPLAPERPPSAGHHRDGADADSLDADHLREAPKQEERSASRGSARHRGGSDYSASKTRPIGKEERMDVFKQYLRDREMARVAHLLALSDDWETQTRKKLFEVHKQTKFQLELVNTEELKEKRYTRVGHKVFMQNLKSSNRCWSNPDISREAKREKTAPEVCQLKKLSKKIYVKPPPAPPPPPPPKPKVDASLAGNMKMSMAGRRGSEEAY